MKQPSRKLVADETKPVCTHAELPLSAASSPHLELAAKLFRAMGDAPRLRLLQLLAKQELCVTEIVAAFGEKFPTISQRLKVLLQEGLIVRRRDGNHMRYSLADRHVANLIANALTHARDCRG